MESEKFIDSDVREDERRADQQQNWCVDWRTEVVRRIEKLMRMG
jgi:hypothetical protein